MLTNEELLNVQGGATSISSLLNSVSKLISTLYSLGQAVGTAIVRTVTKKTCSAS